MNWAAIDERTRQKQEAERKLRDFLIEQQEQSKARKIQQKLSDIQEYRKLIGEPSNALSALAKFNIDQPKQGPRYAQTNPLNIPAAAEQPVQQQSPLDVWRQDSLNGKLAVNAVNQLGYGMDGGLLGSSSEINSRKYVEKNPDPLLPSTSLLSQDDILVKLRFTEEQLIQERRSRSWLESELQNGKSMVATLTAKIESLSDTLRIESATIKELQRQIESTNRNTKDGSMELAAKFEKDQLRLHQMMSDIAAKQRNMEKNNEEADSRHRGHMEELNNLRYRLESFALKANEATTEVRAAAHELDMEQQRGAENFRAIKDHEHALDSLHTSIEAKSESLKRAMEASLQDIRQKVDLESRSRLTFEHNIKELYADVRKVIQNQERTILDRVDASRQMTIQTVDRERQERERSITHVVEQMRSWERAVKETEQQILTNVSSQINEIDGKLNEGHSQRMRFETGLRGDVEDGFRIIQQNLVKRGTELVDSQSELRQTVGNAVKTLQESITLVEKATDAKLSNFENVLRAEIKTRMDTEVKLNQLSQSVDSGMESLQKALIDTLEAVTDELKEADAVIIEELEKKAEQLSQAKTRAVEDLESQIQQISKRIVGDEDETKEKSKKVLIQMEQIQRDYQDAIQQSENRIDDKLTELRTEENDLRVKVNDSQIVFQDIKSSLEEKFTLKTVQMDQTLEAFKEDLRLKFSIKDGEDLESRLKGQITGIYTSVSHLVQSNSNIKDELELKATKKELDEADGKLKTNISNLQSRIVQVNESIAKTNEDVSARATKKELEESSDHHKADVMKLEARDLQIEEIINNVKEDLSDRVFKKQMLESEERIHNQILSLEQKEQHLSSLLEELQSELKLKTAKAEQLESELKLNGQLDKITDEINASIDELKKEFEEKNRMVYEQCALVFGKVTAQVATVESKSESLSNTTESMKVKISDSERILRQQIKDALATQDSVLNAELSMIEKIKEETSRQINDLASKIDDIPRTMHYNDMQYSEFKRHVTEMLQKEQEKTTHWLTEIRENVNGKVSENDFDRIQTDVNSSLQKLSSQVDIEQMSIDQLRSRVQEVELQARDRLRDMRAFQERELGEQDVKHRQERERAFSRFEDIQAKISQYPKQFDSIASDIKRIKHEVEEKVGTEMVKIQKELLALKNEIPQKVSAKTLDDSFNNAINPLRNRIDNLSVLVHDIQSKIVTQDGTKQQENVKHKVHPVVTEARPSFEETSPATIYKPAQYEFKNIDGVRRTGTPPATSSPISPYVPLSQQRSNSIPGVAPVNPNLIEQTIQEKPVSSLLLAPRAQSNQSLVPVNKSASNPQLYPSTRPPRQPDLIQPQVLETKPLFKPDRNSTSNDAIVAASGTIPFFSTLPEKIVKSSDNLATVTSRSTPKQKKERDYDRLVSPSDAEKLADQFTVPLQPPRKSQEF